MECDLDTNFLIYKNHRYEFKRRKLKNLKFTSKYIFK